MFAPVNGTKIFFDVEGLQWVPEGPIMREKPVCLVMHGGPAGTHCNLMPALSPLSEIMQLVYVDDRNCGFSEVGDITKSSIQQNVEDIEALREYLGLDKVFILGHSYGGMKAQYYMIHHPEHLYGAIIISSSARAQDIAGDRVAANVERFGTAEQAYMWTHNGLEDGTFDPYKFHGVMANLYHGKGKFLNAEGQFDFDGYMNALIRCPNVNAEVTNYQMSPEGELSTYDFTEELKNVQLPCLCMSGAVDFLTDVEANTTLAASIPNSEYHIIPNASHMIFDDAMDVMMPLMAEFVERNFK